MQNFESKTKSIIPSITLLFGEDVPMFLITYFNWHAKNEIMGDNEDLYFDIANMSFTGMNIVWGTIKIFLDLKAMKKRKYKTYVSWFVAVFTVFALGLGVPLCIKLANIIDVGDNAIDDCIAYIPIE